MNRSATAAAPTGRQFFEHYHKRHANGVGQQRVRFRATFVAPSGRRLGFVRAQ